MKTSEFIEKVVALPFVGEVVEYGADILMLWSNDGYSILSIDKGKFFNVRTDENGFEDLTEHQQDALMHLVWQYISTPVDEREPEKEFKLRLKDKLGFNHTSYLRYGVLSKGVYVAKWSDSDPFKAIFTESELNEFFTDEQLEWIEMTFDKEVVK